MRVADENGGNAQRVPEVAAADVVERGDDGDATLPQRRRAGQAIEERGPPVRSRPTSGRATTARYGRRTGRPATADQRSALRLVAEVRTDDLRRGAVDQIPTVDAMGVAEIEPVDGVAKDRVAAAMLIDEHDQRQQPRLVPRRLQELFERVERAVLHLARHGANVGHGQAEESIAFAVLARAGAEEAQAVLGAIAVAEGAEPPLDRARVHRHPEPRRRRRISDERA